jgi:CIC family chloride channel protein
LFALEEIMGDLHAAVLGTAVLSSATAWMVLHLVMGDEPLFHVPAYQLVHPAEFIVYAALGVVGGLGSVAFVKLLLGLRQWFKGFPKWSVWFQPVAGGLTVGLMGFFLPDVMGVGYSFVGKVLNGDVVLRTVVLLAILKIVATAVAYGSGNAGGIFGPSLFMGATMGAAVGSVAHRLFPAYTAGPGAYALVGMGTAFAGIVRTPLTSVIMIFEMTRDYTIIVPLMISNLIAYLISYGLQRMPIYEALAHQDGVHLPGAKTRDEAGKMKVSQAMRPVPAVLEEDPEAEEFKRLSGVVAESATTPPHVHPDHQLSLALERMGASGLTVLPVISRADTRRLMGIVLLDDVLRAFGVTRPSEARESAGLN